MAKKETHIPAIIDTPEALEAKIAAMKEAQKLFATYTQEQVDKIFKAAATAADKARIPLAKAAVEETGMGIVGAVMLVRLRACNCSSLDEKRPSTYCGRPMEMALTM